MFKELRDRAAAAQPEPQFAKAQAGRVLIIDGDSDAYVVSAKVKTMPTAIRNFQRSILEQMFMAQAETAEVHLTARTSDKAGRGRIKAFKPYQANRTGKSRPALLEPLREAMALEENWLPEFTVELHEELEADDACMISSYYLGDRGVLTSDDKDLRVTPHRYYERRTGTVLEPCGWGSLWEYVTPAGSMSIEGHGEVFLWAQMLMGDGADNIRGIDKYQGKNCGPVTVSELLVHIPDELNCPEYIINLVLDAYRESDQNPLPEGWLLHMLRSRDDDFYQYLTEKPISKENWAFIQECLDRDWFEET